MLKLTVKPGEYLTIGEEIKVIFSGGSANNLHILIDAPKKHNIVRSKVLYKNAKSELEKETIPTFYKEEGISEAAKAEIREILRREKAQKYPK